MKTDETNFSEQLNMWKHICSAEQLLTSDKRFFALIGYKEYSLFGNSLHRQKKTAIFCFLSCFVHIR